MVHHAAILKCKVCGHAKYISESLPKEPRYESHQVATIDGRKFDICYGGCLHGPGWPNFHKYEEEA